LSDSLRVETVATLAARFGVTRDAIVQEVTRGRLPYVNVGGHWRFREKDIEYWLARRAREDAARLRLIEGERLA